MSGCPGSPIERRQLVRCEDELATVRVVGLDRHEPRHRTVIAATTPAAPQRRLRPLVGPLDDLHHPRAGDPTAPRPRQPAALRHRTGTTGRPRARTPGPAARPAGSPSSSGSQPNRADHWSRRRSHRSNTISAADGTSADFCPRPTSPSRRSRRNAASYCICATQPCANRVTSTRVNVPMRMACGAHSVHTSRARPSSHTGGSGWSSTNGAGCGSNPGRRGGTTRSWDGFAAGPRRPIRSGGYGTERIPCRNSSQVTIPSLGSPEPQKFSASDPPPPPPEWTTSTASSRAVTGGRRGGRRARGRGRAGRVRRRCGSRR